MGLKCIPFFTIVVVWLFAVSALNAHPNLPQVKIEVDQAGIYQVDYTALHAMGWDVDAVDPTQLAMSQGGLPVHFQFVGDDDAQFEFGEAVRFYGWAVDGEARQYTNHNVFWLEVNGDGERITTIEQVEGERVERVSAEITHAPENIFSLTYTRYWPTFDNPFDAWYWEKLSKDATRDSSAAFPIDIAHPVPDGTATYLIETLDRTKRNGHALAPTLNGITAPAHSWDGLINQNIINTISQTALISGTNWLTLTLQSEGADALYLNRVTVNYERELIADDDALSFGYDEAGVHTFVVGGVTESDPHNLQFWEVTNRHAPQDVHLDPQISGNYEIGVENASGAQFLLTHEKHILPPLSLATYTPQSLEPARGGAEWLAITHSSLLTETQRLAHYRETQSELSTHVVTTAEIFEQHGYGLPTPHAIHAYLQHAYATWAVSPEYVVLVGDASLNPRGLACHGSCFSDWTTADENLVPTFLAPLDRQLGLVPIDHFYTLLEGDDDLPDVSIGRLPVQNSAELAPIIDKIITYEQNLIHSPAAEILFIADNTDNAGNFCQVADGSASQWPLRFSTTSLCLDEIGDVETLRAAMFERINQGVLVTQFMGHGFIDGWASEGILSADDMPLLQNGDKPFVQISGNCLDGNYAWVGSESIGESLLQHGLGGSAAHWGSPGLGYLFEHYMLHEAFLLGALHHDLTRIGDAIRFAKTNYISTGYTYAPQAYASTLLGDPAMQLLPTEVAEIPTVATLSAQLTHTRSVLPVVGLLLALLMVSAVVCVPHATSGTWRLRRSDHHRWQTRHSCARD